MSLIKSTFNIPIGTIDIMNDAQTVRCTLNGCYCYFIPMFVLYNILPFSWTVAPAPNFPVRSVLSVFSARKGRISWPSHPRKIHQNLRHRPRVHPAPTPRLRTSQIPGGSESRRPAKATLLPSGPSTRNTTIVLLLCKKTDEKMTNFGGFFSGDT